MKGSHGDKHDEIVAGRGRVEQVASGARFEGE